MNNLIKSLALGKVLLSKRKTATWSAIHRLARKLEFKQSVVDQKQLE